MSINDVCDVDINYRERSDFALPLIVYVVTAKSSAGNTGNRSAVFNKKLKKKNPRCRQL